MDGIKVRELWVVHERVLRHFFSFPTHTRAYFCPQITKDYKMFSMWLQNKDKTETSNALCNFAESPHMCRSSNHIALVHYAACVFCHIYIACGLALVCECGLSGCFMRSWLVWALSAWERERIWRSCVFVGVDVKYIIHYRCMCKFICSL